MLVGRTKPVAKIAAFVLIIVNSITMVCVGLRVFAAVLFAVSVWLIASPDTLVFAVQTFGTASMKVLLTKDTLDLQLGIILAFLAACIFFTSFLGFYGALSSSQFLLFMYSTLVLLLLLLECALIFYFSSNIVEKGISEQDGEWGHILRLTYHCCEHNTTSQNISFTLPWSCCGVGGYPSNCTISNSFKNDCQQTFTKWLDTYLISIYVSLAVFHVVLSSCSIVRRAYSASRPHT